MSNTERRVFTAIFHCPIQIIQRSKGKSAVAAAAYRSGEKLVNEWDGMTHDFTRKSGVGHTEIILQCSQTALFSGTWWRKQEPTQTYYPGGFSTFPEM